MALVLFNSLSGSKQPFRPLSPPEVRMYCCGVTPYDYCHLGHARSYVVWDVLRRYLRWLGYSVYYVQNFTDVDDKILNRAKTEGIPPQQLAERHIQAYFEDFEPLNLLPADAYPRVSQSIEAILEFVQGLLDRGHAYVSQGSIYFSVKTFPDYGKLSKSDCELMQVGAGGRVSESETLQKADPRDFALWKAADPEEVGWPSPWGWGRPGWHIECSAMIRRGLGTTIDIHGGGSDLVFPHHENEIAQSEALTGQPLARFWMHNGMVTVNGRKMSKSLGNYKILRELWKQGLDPMALRLWVLQAHYRKPLDFSEAALTTAGHSWQTLRTALQIGLRFCREDTLSASQEPSAPLLNQQLAQDFQAALDDDLNTPAALSILFPLAKQVHALAHQVQHLKEERKLVAQLKQQGLTLVHLAQVLGFKVEAPSPSQKNSQVSIQELVQQRQAARQSQNFAEADRIRQLLEQQGVSVVDHPSGQTSWHRTADLE